MDVNMGKRETAEDLFRLRRSFEARKKKLEKLKGEVEDLKRES